MNVIELAYMHIYGMCPSEWGNIITVKCFGVPLLVELRRAGYIFIVPCQIAMGSCQLKQFKSEQLKLMKTCVISVLYCVSVEIYLQFFNCHFH